MASVKPIYISLHGYGTSSWQLDLFILGLISHFYKKAGATFGLKRKRITPRRWHLTVIHCWSSWFLGARHKFWGEFRTARCSKFPRNKSLEQVVIFFVQVGWYWLTLSINYMSGARRKLSREESSQYDDKIHTARALDYSQLTHSVINCNSHLMYAKDRSICEFC